MQNNFFGEALRLISDSLGIIAVITGAYLSYIIRANNKRYDDMQKRVEKLDEKCEEFSGKEDFKTIQDRINYLSDKVSKILGALGME